MKTTIKIKQLDRLLLFLKGNRFVAVTELDCEKKEVSLENSILLYTSTGIHLFLPDDQIYIKPNYVKVSDIKRGDMLNFYQIEQPPNNISMYNLGFLAGRFLFNTNRNDIFTKSEMSIEFNQLEHEILKGILLEYPIPKKNIVQKEYNTRLKIPQRHHIRRYLYSIMNNILPDYAWYGDHEDAHSFLSGLYESISSTSKRRIIKDISTLPLITQILVSLFNRNTFCKVEYRYNRPHSLSFTNSITRNLKLKTKVARYYQIPYMSTPVPIPLWSFTVKDKVCFHSNNKVTLPVGLFTQLGIRVKR